MSDAVIPFALGRVHHADCLEAMRHMPDECIQCCVTSPPYWGLRKYEIPDIYFVHGDHGQLGLDSTPGVYVERLVSIFREVRRVMRSNGTLWLNIGDTYNNMSPIRGRSADAFERKYTGGKISEGPSVRRSLVTESGLKMKDLIGIPWLLAFALRNDGWFLRAEMIWHKTSSVPEPVRDRPTRAHEQIFLLSKAARYLYNYEADSSDAIFGGKNATFRRTVWSIGPEASNTDHPASFPCEVARRCIVAGSKVGDTVLDPFAGSGTTLVAAEELQRQSLGFDLGEKYVEQANARIAAWKDKPQKDECEKKKPPKRKKSEEDTSLLKTISELFGLSDDEE